jgi:hypothetical protein
MIVKIHLPPVVEQFVGNQFPVAERDFVEQFFDLLSSSIVKVEEIEPEEVDVSLPIAPVEQELLEEIEIVAFCFLLKDHAQISESRNVCFHQ